MFKVTVFQSALSNQNNQPVLLLDHASLVPIYRAVTLKEFLDAFTKDLLKLFGVYVKMFKNTFQSGFLSILSSGGSRPLAIWDKQVKNGYIRRITDEEIKSLALELTGTNVATTYITAPRDSHLSLGVKLAFLSLLIKNLKKYFSFEITVLDDKNLRRRIRLSNYQSTTRVRPFCCSMPIALNPGWNQIQFNLADFTRRAYGTTYVECVRVQIHANCRVRRVFFSDRLYTEDTLPVEYKLLGGASNRRQSEADDGGGGPAESP